MGAKAADGQRLIQVQLARASVVIETVDHVGVLLDLAQDQACADRVHGAGRDEEGVAWPGVEPLEKALNFAGDRGGARLLRRQ